MTVDFGVRVVMAAISTAMFLLKQWLGGGTASSVHGATTFALVRRRLALFLLLPVAYPSPEHPWAYRSIYHQLYQLALTTIS